jgi:hypothetical protein
MLGLFGALILLIAAAGTASANLSWCVSDPPIQVVTPAGNHVTVNNMIYIAQSESRLGSAITESATAAAIGPGHTLITVLMGLPSGITLAHVVSSVYRYRVSSQADGTGGTIITLFLDVPIA